MNMMDLVERGLVPDGLIRAGIRRRLAGKLGQLHLDDVEARDRAEQALLREWWSGPIALVPELANEQHYEVPPALFEAVLGPNLKYSCGLHPQHDGDLEESERRMLALTEKRAEIEDGMRILDLGCGWGSLSLWIARRHPHARVVAVSNSKDQREFILGRAAERGLSNVEVITEDVNRFDTDERFDRVVSVEMVEHVRNHPLLLSRVARWLEPDGRLFLHHFAHRETFYPYEAETDDDWMARHFFSGGIMPSADYFLQCQEDLVALRRWRVSGKHYERTSNLWLERLDASRDALMPVLAETYGEGEAARWLVRWRLFFMACAELFGFDGGNEWMVVHVLMAPRARRARGGSL